MRKSLAVFSLSATTLAASVILAAGPASAAQAARSVPADSTITATYPVSGSTTISKLNTTIAVGPGTLVSTLDTTTSTLTGTLTLPPATGSFKILGIPVTATTEFVQSGTATGTLKNGVVTTTAQVTVKLTSLKAAGIPIPLGPRCETSTPASITLTSQAGFNVLNGGNLAGTYTIPSFSHCGLATFLINLTIPGAGNTITLTLGKAKIG